MSREKFTQAVEKAFSGPQENCEFIGQPCPVVVYKRCKMRDEGMALHAQLHRAIEEGDRTAINTIWNKTDIFDGTPCPLEQQVGISAETGKPLPADPPIIDVVS